MPIIFIILLFRSEKTAEKRADRGACGFIAASVLDVQEQEKRKRDNDMRRLSAVLLLGYQKRETAFAISLFFGNRQRPILPGRVQVRYQTLALGSSLTLPSSYARYSALSCDSGGSLPCCYQKKKRQHSLSLLLVTGNVLPSQVVSMKYTRRSRLVLPSLFPLLTLAIPY